MNLRSIEAKAFVPARDFDVSLQFYQELGFTLVWSTGELAYFRHGNSVFLLQKFHVNEHAENFKMHLLVESVDDWWQRLRAARILERYSVKSEPPADRPWGMRDFVLIDPSGVMWRIGQPIVDAAFGRQGAMKSPQSLHEHILGLEERLLRPEVRQSSQTLDELLGDEFMEFASNGASYDKARVIAALQSEPLYQRSIADFHLVALAENLVHATYRMTKLGQSHEPTVSLRSSLWKARDGRWQLIFHQGTLGLAP